MKIRVLIFTSGANVDPSASARQDHTIPVLLPSSSSSSSSRIRSSTHIPRRFPKPDAKHAETILAIPRATSGKSIAAKDRKSGRVPSIVFEQEDGQHGGNKRLISVQINQIKKLVNHLGRSYFLSRLFDLEVRPTFDSNEIIDKVLVLPRWIHLHAGTDAVLNVTFLRASSHALLKVDCVQRR